MKKGEAEVKEAVLSKDDPERESRLAEALRTNLRRRKAQARAAAVSEPPSRAGDPPGRRDG